MDGRIGATERFLRQPDIARAVLDQQNLYGRVASSDLIHDFLSPASRVKRNVEPCPGCDSTEMLPPCRSTIFLQMANPMPVPSNSSRLCKRSNMPNILSKYFASIPSPLSLTEKTHLASPFFARLLAQDTWIWGIPGGWYLIALPMRF